MGEEFCCHIASRLSEVGPRPNAQIVCAEIKEANQPTDAARVAFHSPVSEKTEAGVRQGNTRPCFMRCGYMAPGSRGPHLASQCETTADTSLGANPAHFHSHKHDFYQSLSITGCANQSPWQMCDSANHGIPLEEGPNCGTSWEFFLVIGMRLFFQQLLEG
ncbi:hypothetical protein SKAU_G00286170 [Synaphobranchus kaupii]|uniref:Uncharacterized protein n=1 Tax=Synaphobranchus kaupii TaxID=118154 RepID=A0A9Q1IP73_SYNKA|nr:hypothetical protein SKAU_G00286170 [Synaphobranchus kaupii]